MAQRLDQARYAVSEMRQGAQWRLEDQRDRELEAQGIPVLAKRRRKKTATFAA
jgi:hypothetical protein